MKLADGTEAEVTALTLEGFTISATVDFTYADGRTGRAWVSLSPAMVVQSGQLDPSGKGVSKI